MKLKNYIFIDKLEMPSMPSDLQDEITTSDFTDDIKLVIINTRNSDGEQMASFIKEQISLGHVLNYAIITAFPNRYKGHFISNNVINAHGKTAEQIVKDVIWIFNNFGKERKMCDNTWFISDPHFCHSNIIKYCNRPFADTVEMDAEMIRRWNSVVGKDDIVWCLGDFAFGNKENVKKILSQLNGKVNLVLGNHDRQEIDFYYKAGFHRVYDHPVIINGYFILTHEPMEFLNKNCPFVNLFGHIHDSQMYQTYTSNSVCLCAERWNYTPVSWKQIYTILEELNDEKQCNG